MDAAAAIAYSKLNLATSIVNADVSTTAEIAASKLASADLAKMGIDGAATVRRGKSIVATEQSTTSTSYTTLTTPDRVSSVVLPTDGFILVWYQAMWKESNAQNARAGIFLGSNQVKAATMGTAAPAVFDAVFASGTGSQVDEYGPLVSDTRYGLYGTYTQASGDIRTAYTGDVTTGQVQGVRYPAGDYFGGPVYIFAAAGTYDVSVQFKVNAAGSVTVKERKLLVATMGF